MSKQYLLPNVERHFKANMHTHTTLSDGDMTPEEVKAIFKAHGYQIVAFTDHEVCVAHSDLNDDDFLAITAYELAVNPSGCRDRGIYEKCYHLNLFARKQSNTKHVCFDRGYVRDFWPVSKLEIETYSEENRTYSTEYVNHLIEEADKAGFFVSLNHPNWSLQDYTDYIGLKGLWGVEVHNSECCTLGYQDCTSQVYEDMLRAGTKIFPLATDDCHHLESMCLGSIRIAAKSLTYPDVIAAMENGDFYATTGPEIHSLTLEDGKLKITCSPCRTIHVNTECRRAFRATAKQGELLTEAEFDLQGWYKTCLEGHEDTAYFRLTLEDAEGKKAYTRAYSRKETEEQF